MDIPFLKHLKGFNLDTNIFILFYGHSAGIVLIVFHFLSAQQLALVCLQYPLCFNFQVLPHLLKVQEIK